MVAIPGLFRAFQGFCLPNSLFENMALKSSNRLAGRFSLMERRLAHKEATDTERTELGGAQVRCILH